jgi:F-type H+-transporting ATPase subunit delta
VAGERTLARRYARALLSVAAEQGKVDEVEQDLHGLAEAWDGSRELRTMIAHPSVPRDRKRQALRALFQGKVQDATLRFLDLLLAKRRFPVLPQISEEFDLAADELQSIAKVRVRTFLPLTDAQRAKLIEKLNKFNQRKNIEIAETVDPTLLGGLVIRVGDQVLDGSIAGRLKKLRERLHLREDERAQLAAAAAATIVKA